MEYEDTDDWDDDFQEDWDEEGDDTYPCPECGAEVYEDADVCPVCGSYLFQGGLAGQGQPWWTFGGVYPEWSPWWFFLAMAGIICTIFALMVA